MTKIIEIIVTAEGNSTVQTTGFTGSSCRDASKFVEEALGNRTAEHLTAEFYQQSAESVHQQHHG